MKQLFAGIYLIALLQMPGKGLAQSALGLSHVVLPVRELTISLPFYRNVLGLTGVAVPGALASTQAWFDVGGGQQLRLIEKRSDASSLRTGSLLLALRVSSLRQTEQQLRQRGASVTRQTNASGRPALLLTDPDGYVLELSEGKAPKSGFLQSAGKWLWQSITTVE